VLTLTLAACGTALAAGLGALPVYALGPRAARAAPALWGVAAIAMVGAAVFGLLGPAFDTDPVGGLIGAAAGVGALLAARGALGRREDLHVGALRGAGARRAALVLGTLTLHSLPEGLAMGAAWAAGGAASGPFVVLAIALQNVPEGTVVALPLREGGATAGQAFWIAVGTSAPQPAGALLAYAVVSFAGSTAAAMLGLAAGAMLALVVTDVLPAAGIRGLPRRRYGPRRMPGRTPRA
jgi:zinc transporter, ZIP family